MSAVYTSKASHRRTRRERLLLWSQVSVVVGSILVAVSFVTGAALIL